jgi:methyl-accepting chemotaxis protein
MARWENLSLRSQLIVPVLVGGAIVVAAVIVVMSSVRNRTVEQAGVNTAGAVAAQIVSLRGFYTDQIVSRARTAGMDISHDFAGQDKTLPLRPPWSRRSANRLPPTIRG